MPTISGITGAVTHGQSITITGTGFGTKAVAAPLVWDDASGPDDIRDKWYDGWPKTCANTFHNIQRRAPIRGVNPPHGRANRYIAGAHAQATATSGFDVLLWKVLGPVSPSITPVDVYASAWMRCDPAWTFKGDNNFKSFYWRTAANATPVSPIDPAGISFEYNPRPTDLSSTFKGWRFYSSDGDLTIFNTNGESYSGGQLLWVGTQGILNPMAQWVKYEYVFRFGASGFLRVFENGRQVSFYNGHTDTHSSSHRSFTLGAFARAWGEPGNFRYFTDCYLDTTHQRVILGNNASLAACTVREVQVPTSWSDTSSTVTVNRGVIGDNDPAYLFVVDADSLASSGFLVDETQQEQPPVITSPLSVSVIVGDATTYQIVAANNPTSFTANPLPVGRVLNSSTGEITGTYDQVGFTQTVVSVTNVFGVDEETVSFDVSQSAVSGIENPVNIGTASNKLDTTLSVTSQTLVPTGNTIFVLVSCCGGTISTGIPTCSDNVSFAQYVRDVYKTNADGSRKAAIFRYSNNVELPIGSVITVSIDGGVGDAKAMTAFWVRGLDLIAPVDVFSSAVSEVSTTTPNSGQITTT